MIWGGNPTIFGNIHYIVLLLGGGVLQTLSTGNPGWNKQLRPVLYGLLASWGPEELELGSFWVSEPEIQQAAVHTDENWLVVQVFFIFHPYLGKISNLTNIFQRGWNHELEKNKQEERKVIVNFNELSIITRKWLAIFCINQHLGW